MGGGGGQSNAKQLPIACMALRGRMTTHASKNGFLKEVLRRFSEGFLEGVLQWASKRKKGSQEGS